MWETDCCEKASSSSHKLSWFNFPSVYLYTKRIFLLIFSTDLICVLFSAGRSLPWCTQLPSSLRFPARRTLSSPASTSWSASMAASPPLSWSCLETTWVGTETDASFDPKHRFRLNCSFNPKLKLKLNAWFNFVLAGNRRNQRHPEERPPYLSSFLSRSRTHWHGEKPGDGWCPWKIWYPTQTHTRTHTWTLVTFTQPVSTVWSQWLSPCGGPVCQSCVVWTVKINSVLSARRCISFNDRNHITC